MPVAVLAEAPEVISQLEAMELDRTILIQIALAANAERALCTANDVSGFDLITMHDKLVRGLRDAFCGKAWERDDLDKQAGIRNPRLNLRIIACNFDQDAGNPADHIHPTNRVQKGNASLKKARCNRTLWLPGFDIPAPKSDGLETWVFGVHADDDQPVRAELSLPTVFEGGQYVLFKERIILLTGKEHDPIGSRKPADGPAPVEVVDIDIRRK